MWREVFECALVHLCLSNCECDREIQRRTERENLDSCLFVCIICIMCLTLCVCFSVSVCVCTRTHELYICPDLVGSTNWFWALGLIALLQT